MAAFEGAGADKAGEVDEGSAGGRLRACKGSLHISACDGWQTHSSARKTEAVEGFTADLHRFPLLLVGSNRNQTLQRHDIAL